MGSDYEEVFISAMHKLREFEELGYPVNMRRSACHRVSLEGVSKGGGMIWLAVGIAQR